MVSLGSARIVNRTAKQREDMVTVVIPCPDQAIWSSTEIANDAVTVTVNNAESAPGAQRCQTHIQGARWPSGNPKYVRATFRTEIGAGVSNANYPYSNYLEKTVTFDDTSTSGTTFAFNSQLVSNIADINFRLGIPILVNGLIEYRHITIPLVEIAQTFREYEQEGHSSGTEQRIKTFKLIGRNAGDRQIPSFYVEILLEVPHDMRHIKFWYTFGNSLITNKDPSTSPYWPNTSWVFQDLVYLEINGVNSRIRHAGAKLPQTPIQCDSGATYTLIDPINQPSTAPFPDGSQLTVKGVLLLDQGSPSTLEQDTIDAEALDDVDAVHLGWADHDSFGPHGQVPPLPNNTIITSEAVGRYKAAEQLDSDYNAQSSFGTPTFRPVHGDQPSPQKPSGTANHGQVRGHIIARSGQPDFRSIELGVMQISHHPMHYRELDVSLMDPFNYTGKNAGYWSDVELYFCRVWFGNGSSVPYTNPILPNTEFFGKHESSNTMPLASWALSGEQWFNPDFEHHVFNWLGFLGLMGNRWARRMCEDVTNVTLAVYWPYEPDQHALPMSNFYTTRAEGRTCHSLLWMYLVTGDSRITTRIADRATNIYDTMRRAVEEPVLKIFKEGASSGINYGASHPTQPGALVDDVFVCWQECMTVQFFYAAWKVTGDARLRAYSKEVAKTLGYYSTRKNSDSGGVREMAKAILMDPYTEGVFEPLAEADKTNGFISPWTQGPAAQWDAILPWQVGAFLIGWEFAREDNDSTWMTNVSEALQAAIGNEENFKGTYGWGNSGTAYDQNMYENAGVFDDIFAARTLTGPVQVPLKPSWIHKYTPAFTVTSDPKSLGTISFTQKYAPSFSLTAANKAFFDFAFTSKYVPNFTIAGSNSNFGFLIGTSYVPSFTVTPVAYRAPDQSEMFGEIKVFTPLIIRSGSYGIMTNTDQIFEMWSGDLHILKFTVLDTDGERSDLDGVSDIVWKLSKVVSDTVLINKSLTSGGVTILPQTGDTKGQFTVQIDPADTVGLQGKHYHQAKITSGTFGTTVAVGSGIIQPSTP